MRDSRIYAYLEIYAQFYGFMSFDGFYELLVRFMRH